MKIILFLDFLLLTLTEQKMKFTCIALGLIGYAVAGGDSQFSSKLYNGGWSGILSTSPNGGQRTNWQSSGLGQANNQWGSSQNGQYTVQVEVNSGTYNTNSYHPSQSSYANNQYMRTSNWYSRAGNEWQNYQYSPKTPNVIGTFDYTNIPKSNVQTNVPILLPIPPNTVPYTPQPVNNGPAIVAPIQILNAPIPVQPTAPVYPVIDRDPHLITQVSTTGQITIKSENYKGSKSTNLRSSQQQYHENDEKNEDDENDDDRWDINEEEWDNQGYDQTHKKQPSHRHAANEQHTADCKDDNKKHD